KQHKKKQRPRGDELRDKLARLHARGAWGEYLAVAHRSLASPAGSAPHYLEVVDHAITAALASGDVAELVELARALAHRAAGRPLVSLAGAVAALAAGHKEQARTALADLAAAAAAGPLSPAMVAAVENLCALAGADQPAPPVLLSVSARELLALERVLGGEDGGAVRKRSGPAFTTPFAKAVAALAGVLAELAQAGFAAERRHVTALRKAAGALGDVPGAGERAAVNEVAGAAEALADLASGFLTLCRSPQGSPYATLLHWLTKGHGELESLERLLAGDAGEGLLRHFRLAARTIWWRMLRLATKGDAGALADLLDRHAALVIPQVAAAGEAPPGWLEAQRQRHQAMSALNGDRHVELAELLAATARGERDSGRLATLWALEIDALHRASAGLDDEIDDDSDELEEEAFDPDDLPEDRDGLSAGRLHFLLVARLAAIAGQLGRSVPSGQRTAVARILRTHLLAVSEAVALGLPVARTAAALLEHLPDDPALLVAAEAGFECAESPREGESIARRIATRRPAALIDPEAVAVFMRAIADEDPMRIAAILAAVRPLFLAREWAGVVRPVADAVADTVVNFLKGHRKDPRVMRALKANLELLSPHLEGIQVFEAAQAVAELACAFDRGLQLIAAYQRRFPSQSAALDLLRPAFFAFKKGSEAERHVVEDLAAAAVDRLGPNWEIWLDSLLILIAATATTPAALTFQRRLRAVLRIPGLPAHAREEIKAAIALSGRLQREERRCEHEGGPSRPPAASRGRRRSERSAGKQLKLDL
ncbi:MAG: hypothetical protein V1750_06825, partial [Acidobacteriota bacterium]